MAVCILYCILLIHSFDGIFGQTTNYYVSTQGSNQNDGTNIDQPWLTLQHAISRLRTIRGWNPGPENHATINLLEGVYFQDSTMKLAKRYIFSSIFLMYQSQINITSLGIPTLTLYLIWMTKFPYLEDTNYQSHLGKVMEMSKRLFLMVLVQMKLSKENID